MTDWKLIRDGDTLVLRDSDDGGGNYMRKMEKLVKEHPEFKGNAIMVDVYRDDSCAALKGEACNCDPDLKVRQ